MSFEAESAQNDSFSPESPRASEDQAVRNKVARSDERSNHWTALLLYWLRGIAEGWAEQRRRQIVRSTMSRARRRLKVFRRIRNANMPADTAQKVTRRMIHFESQLALNDAIMQKAGLLLIWPFVILGAFSFFAMPFLVNYMFDLGYGILALLGIWCASMMVVGTLGICLFAPAFLPDDQKTTSPFIVAIWMALCLVTYVFVFYLIVNDLDWSRMSWYMLAIVSGLLSLFFYIVAVALAIVARLAAASIYSARLRRSLADASLAHSLLKALDSTARAERDWESLAVKRKLMKELEAAAEIASQKVRRALPTSDMYTDAWLRHRLEGVGAALRAKKCWVCMPKADTQQHLVESLARALVNVALGNWDNIETTEAQHIVPQKMGIRLRSAVLGTLAALLPAAVYQAADLLALLPEGALKDYFAVGVVVWAVISLLFVIDPKVAEKTEMIQRFTSMLPGISKKDTS